VKYADLPYSFENGDINEATAKFHRINVTRSNFAVPGKGARFPRYRIDRKVDLSVDRTTDAAA